MTLIHEEMFLSIMPQCLECIQMGPTRYVYAVCLDVLIKDTRLVTSMRQTRWIVSATFDLGSSSTLLLLLKRVINLKVGNTGKSTNFYSKTVFSTPFPFENAWCG